MAIALIFSLASGREARRPWQERRMVTKSLPRPCPLANLEAMKRTTLTFLLFVTACSGGPDSGPGPQLQGTGQKQQFGTVHFPVSCNEAASRYMQRGLALLHHMTYEQAEESFAAAAEADPECGMAYWGMAMSYIHPLWPDVIPEEQLAMGWELVAKAKTTGEKTKRELAYIPDEPKLFDALTVWEHLEFIAAAYRVPDFEKKATKLLEEFELIEKRNTPAQQLSRGMRQKVAISCGYLHSPRAILFDEPLTGLDPRAIRTLTDTVRARAADGAAVIISSHLLALVQDLCSLLLILKQGKCLFFGPIQEARTRFEDLSSDASLEEVFFRATED